MFCYFVLKIISKQFSVSFRFFLSFLIDFQFLCCLAVSVVRERVLNDLKRFDTNLVNKLFKNTFFLVLGHKNHF